MGAKLNMSNGLSAGRLYRTGPILMCEQGARLRRLNLDIASADAAHWWDTGKVPLRPTPFAGQQPRQAMKFFECKAPDGDGCCSDNACPCPQVAIKRGNGYLFVDSQLVAFRSKYPAEKDADLAMEREIRKSQAAPHAYGEDICVRCMRPGAPIRRVYDQRSNTTIPLRACGRCVVTTWATNFAGGVLVSGLLLAVAAGAAWLGEHELSDGILRDVAFLIAVLLGFLALVFLGFAVFSGPLSTLAHDGKNRLDAIKALLSCDEPENIEREESYVKALSFLKGDLAWAPGTLTFVLREQLQSRSAGIVWSLRAAAEVRSGKELERMLNEVADASPMHAGNGRLVPEIFGDGKVGWTDATHRTVVELARRALDARKRGASQPAKVLTSGSDQLQFTLLADQKGSESKKAAEKNTPADNAAVITLVFSFILGLVAVWWEPFGYLDFWWKVLLSLVAFPVAALVGGLSATFMERLRKPTGKK